MTGTIFLGANEYSVGEREPFVTITIKRDGDTSGAVSVSYATNPDNAAPGIDYSATSGTAVIAAGASSTTIRIPIINDQASEPTEKFNVSLINVDSGTLLFPRTTLVSILDDENPIVEPVNPPQTSPYQVRTTDAVTGLAGPMQIEWIEDSNYALVSEKEGRIKIVDFNTGRVVSTLLDIVGKVNADADRGLLDIALHPDLENHPYLYAFYVVDPADVKASGPASADNLGNRYAHLVRYELDMSGTVPTIKPGTETVMLGGAGRSLADISGGGALDFTDPIHSAQRASDVNTDGTYKQDYIKVDSRSHAGGAIAFGPDGALYVSTGDGTSYNYADPRTASVQNINSLSGKILRIDPLTGDGFADNPYATANLDANASKVWQMGLRNPYAMTFTEDGRILISETGWYSWEEINSGGKGANYGWPYYEGADNGEINKTPGYQTMPGASQFYTNVANGTIVITPAFRAFSHTASDPGYQMSAIVGGTSVYDGDRYPEIFKGDYFFSDIVDGDIFAVDVNDRTQLQYVTNIGTYHAVSFVQGPDGYIYYTDITGNKIVRFEITDPNAVPNRAPVLANPIADSAGTSGTALSIVIPANAFSDPDGDQLALAASLSNGQPLPAWLTFNAATRTFAGTPPAAQSGPIDIRVTATDPDGLATNDIFRLTIGGTANNTAPVVAAAIADQSGTAGVLWSYKLPANTFADADNDALTFVATQANGQSLPTWVNFNAQTATFSGTPPAGTTGPLAFRVTATDPKGAAVSDEFTFTIGAAGETIVNDVASQNQFANGTSANDVFRYAGNSNLYQWGPTEDGKSLIVWTRSSTDNTFDVLTGFEKLRFADKTVSLADLDPQGPDFADIADTIQQLTGKTSADRFIVNGASTAYAWGNTTDGKGLVIWTLSATDDTYDILTGFDQLVFADRTIYLTGTPPANTAPVVANPVPDQTVAEGAAFSFILPANTFTDANGDQLTLNATTGAGAALPAWLSFNAATRTFSGRPDDANIGTLSVRVAANDGKGGTVSDTFDIRVTPVNDAPVLKTPVPDQAATRGGEFSFAIPAGSFTDADGDLLSYSATLSSGQALPAWLRFDATTRLLSGMAPANGENLSIVVTASDGKGSSASDMFTLLLYGNRPPELVKPVPDLVANEKQSFSYVLPADMFRDLDGDTLSVSILREDGSPLPSWLSYQSASRTLFGTPLDMDKGATIRVTATDGKGGSVSDVFALTVNAVNDAPELARTLPDYKLDVGAALSYTPNAPLSFIDKDGDMLTFSAKLADGNPLPGWIAVNPVNGHLTSNGAQAGQYDIVVTATDPGGLSVSDTFRLTVEAGINNAPVLGLSVVDQTIANGSSYQFTLAPGMFTDQEDGLNLSYSATLASGDPLPAWLTFVPGTRILSGTAPAGVGGAYEIRITATDAGGLSASDTFRITVTPPANVAPIVVNPIANQVTPEGTVFTFKVPDNVFNDANGDPLTVYATNDFGGTLPGWLSFDSGTRTFTGRPDDAQVGTISLRVYAQDGRGGTAWDMFDLTVAPMNDAPVVGAPITDQKATHTFVFSFALPANTFTDADGDALSLSARLADGSGLPVWLAFDPATRIFSGIPAAADVGKSLDIVVTASDGKGGTVTDTFTIDVLQFDRGPRVMVPLEDQATTEGASFAFVIPSATFFDDEPLTYSAALANGGALPGWLRFDAATRTFAGIPNDGQAGTIEVTVTARDPGGNKATDTFSLVIRPDENSAPTLTAPMPDLNGPEDTLFRYTLPSSLFADADGDTVAVSMRVIGGEPLPAWLSFDPTTRTLQGNPPANFSGIYGLEVVGNDGKGGIVTDRFDLHIKPVNDAPALVKSIADSAVTAGQSYSFALPSGTFADIDDAALSYTATLANGSPLPGWLAFNAATRTFTGAPGDSHVGSLAIKVTARDPGGLMASDEFSLTIGARPIAETLYQNTTASQYIDAGDGKDVFVLGGNSSTYSWGPTQDGRGVVIWDSKGFDILFNFEELRFTNKTVAVASILGNGTSDFLDDPTATQFLIGKTNADRFIIDAASADYGWGKTADGKGVVVWSYVQDDVYDVLTGFDRLVFDDREIDISDLGQV